MISRALSSPASVVLIGLLYWAAAAAAARGGPLTGVFPDSIAKSPQKFSARFVETPGPRGKKRYFLAGTRVSILMTAAGIALFPGGDGLDPKGTLWIRFSGASPSSGPRGLDALPAKVHVFRGRDPAKWRTNAPTFRSIVYPEIYPGIDLVFEVNDSGLKSEFRVDAGADPSQIRWRYTPEVQPVITRDGSLSVELGSSRVFEEKPLAFQRIDGLRKPIAAEYAVTDGVVAFSLSPHDKDRPLVIDPPILVYSSYLTGDSGSDAYDIAVDAEGFIYVAGSTRSIDFPLRDPIEPFPQGLDFFVSKFDPTGTQLVFSTFLGGESDEGFFDAGMAIGPDGTIYITAQTDSTDLPVTEGAYDTECNGVRFACNDIFVARIDTEGARLIYSTYLGGSGFDASMDIAVDSDGSAWVSGTTSSTDFPTVNPVQAFLNGNGDAVLAKLNSAGTELLFSTYLGGLGGEDARAVVVDSRGRPAIAGLTSSEDFPVLRAFQPLNRGGLESYVTAFDDQGQIRFSTYLGGTLRDEIFDMALDSSGNFLIAGTTESTDFPVRNPLQRQNRRPSVVLDEAFVTKMRATGESLIFSTYLGGAGGFDMAQAITSDAAGNVLVAGVTSSSDFPLVAPVQRRLNGDWDIFVATIEPAGDNLLFSTYLGGSRFEQARSIFAAPDGAIYVAGTSDSTDFPPVNAFQMGPKAGAVFFKLDDPATRRLWFPLVGSGHDGNRIRFRTDLILLNASRDPAEAKVRFFDSSGRPLEFEIGGRGRGVSFAVPFSAGERIVLRTGDDEALRRGYAVVETSRQLDGTLIFVRSDIPSNRVLYEAGLPSARPLKRFRVVVDRRGGRNTGLALVNTEGGVARLRLRLHDKQFNLLKEVEMELPAGGHFSRFVNELFEGALQPGDNFEGAVTVQSDRPLAAFTLRQREGPGQQQNPTLTVFPVVAFPNVTDR